MSWLFGDRARSEWIAEYARAHQHPVNRVCHTLGIPLVAVSIAGLLVSLALPVVLAWSLAGFVVGWIFQFVGHAFEGKPPEFFRDWRFLLVGLSWWWLKVSGKQDHSPSEGVASENSRD